MKICSKCKLEKELSEFNKNKAQKDGHEGWCRICKGIFGSKKRNKDKFNKWHRDNRGRYLKIERSFRDQYHQSLKGYSSRLYSGAKFRAKNKNLEFNLTSDWIFEKVSKLICEATNFNLNIEKGVNCKTNPLQPTLDRIDSSKGYTLDNTRVTCWWWNVMKQDWSDQQIIELIKQYKK